MFYIKKRPALFKRGKSERRKEMQKQYSYRVLSFILALLLLAAAVPTALFASADEFGRVFGEGDREIKFAIHF